MITSISWVPRGAARCVPDEAEPPTEEEINQLVNTMKIRGEGESEEDEEMDLNDENQADEVVQALNAANALGKPPKSKASGTDLEDVADGLKELNMENYDDEDDDAIDVFASHQGKPYYPSNDMDPYLKDKDDDDSEDLEDVNIKPDDSVVVCARFVDDIGHLEVLIMEDLDGDVNTYVHHDIPLMVFPLCTAWLDCPLKGGEKGNFVAVGSMDPAIEIWDLDVIDVVQPSLTLGGVAEKKKKGKKKTVKYKQDSHTGPVLGLAWNKTFRNVLASASADSKVKIWDVATGSCSLTLDHHTDKVQVVAWNHREPNVLLSGSFDKSVVLRDGKKPSHPGIKWSVNADVEGLAWDPHNEHCFVVSLENGNVSGFDIRVASDSSAGTKPSFTIDAHDKAVSSISYNCLAPNLLATGSMDKSVKLWDLSNNQPSCVATYKPQAGAIFSVSFSNECPFLLGIGGSKGDFKVWDTLSDAGVSRKYERYNSQGPLS